MGDASLCAVMAGSETGGKAHAHEKDGETDAATPDGADNASTDESDHETDEPDPAARRCGISLGDGAGQ